MFWCIRTKVHETQHYVIVYFPQLLSWKRRISYEARMKLFYCTWRDCFLLKLYIQWNIRVTVEVWKQMNSLYFPSGYCSSKNLSNIYMKLVLKRISFFLLCLTRWDNRRVSFLIIQILNFSSKPIFERLRMKNELMFVASLRRKLVIRVKFIFKMYVIPRNARLS